MAHSGIYKLKKPGKYTGDGDNVVYRSSWERAAFVWCERNDNVVQWSSEEVVIPYFYEVDKRHHRYFADLKIKYADGTTKLVEIKPAKETQPPVKPAKKTKRYLSEAFTFVKNQNKWKAAEEYAKDRGWSFEIWTEDVLQAKGILPKQLKGLKKIKPLPQPKLKKKMSDTKPFPRMKS